MTIGNAYRRRGAPVLLQIHGGGWTLGNKHEQALPLIYHLAQHAWDMFRSLRAMESVHAVTRFLEWVRAAHGA